MPNTIIKKEIQDGINRPNTELLYKIIISVILLAVILVILFRMQPVILEKTSNYRQGINCPPDGCEHVAITGAILLTGFVLLINSFFINRLKGIKKVIINLLVIVLFFYTLEAAVGKYALQHISVSYRPHPLLLWRRIHGINSYGFAYPEFPAKKEPGEFRFVLVGDSNAEGFGFKRFSDVMEKRLQDEYPQKKIRLINAACTGYSIVQVKNLMDMMIYKLDPDCVIISINNDPMDDYMQDKHRIPPKNLLPFLNVLYKSRLYLLMRKYKLNKEYTLYQHDENFYKARMTQRVVPEDVDKYYSDVIDETRKRGINVIVMVNPSNYKHVDYDTKYKNQLVELCKKKNVLYVDLFNEWMKYDRDKLFLDTVHTTNEGHKIIGDRMSEFIIKEKIIEKQDN